MTAISLGFVLLTILILWFVIGSKGHWLGKAALILASLYFCLSVGFSVNNFMGWPTSEELPKKFLVHWAVIDEPDAKSGSEGNIYVWTKPLSTSEKKYDTWDDYLLSFYDGKSQPRAYRLPYSRGLHKKTQEAMGMIMKGEGVGGINDGKDGKGKENKSGKKSGEGNEEGSLTKDGQIMFHKLPPVKLPDK